MIPTNYDPQTSEEKWYQYWLEHRFFHSTVDKKRTPYCIVIPPPNVTGVLHMGHMLNNTIQDVLVRRARLLGKNACWVPGTDHASIATEAKVVAKLKSEGIEKRILETCLGMDRETRRDHPRTVETTGSFLRLGPDLFHDGRDPFGQRDPSLYRPVQ